MAKLFLMFISLLFTSGLYAQQFYFGAGNTLTYFNYKNSQGEKLDNLQASNNYYLATGFKLPIKKSKLKLVSGLNYNRYGASGSEPGFIYQWDMTYLGLDVGFEYDVLRLSDFFNQNNGFVKDREGLFIYLKGAFSGEYMLNGKQQVNDMLYNLSGVEQFDTPFFFARGGLGINYGFSEDIGVFAQYLGGMSLPLIKGKDDGNEKLNLITHQIGFGLLIGISH